ncbi:MAG: Maf family protein [Devosia sp.]|jgi:septum formation protein|uniref:Maf family protein n=1 Tax=unclassified Devosia TaxID=196773 RepID=UPI001A0CD67D|nr:MULTISPECIES: Maf family protein [unclassified Devosia]MBF0677377.1 Maf family protein [Devosia sp.]WEJ33438.1 Maf family protein [Devosia sp. SD17-2]
MLILASSSATRKALLDKAGLPFSAEAAAIDERSLEAEAIAAGADGRDVALLLARHKAEAVSALHPDALVIGADQTLALGLELLHKPSDRADAEAQLDHLRGKTHRLHAAVTLVRNGELIWSDIQTAELTMREFTAEERDTVLDLEGDEALHSVGGYRLEGPSIRLFETVVGDYFTILGLPLLPLLAALRDIAPELLTAQAHS